MTRAPWATLLFVAIAGTAGALPGGVEALEYRHAEASAGAWWRPLTGQLVHWTGRMAVVDLGAVAILGAALERRSRRAAIVAIAGALLLTALGLHCLPPAPGRYRGASSVASGLFVALALDIAMDRSTRPGMRAAPRAARLVAIAALGLFLLKIAYETSAGRALFAGEMGPGVAVSPRAHLLGALAGVVAWLATAARANRPIEDAVFRLEK